MQNKDDIVIVSAARTPFSNFTSAMGDIPSIDLGVMVMKEVVSRVGINPGEIDEINYGSCVLAELALETDVPARQATLLAGFPAENISLPLIGPAAPRSLVYAWVFGPSGRVKRKSS